MNYYTQYLLLLLLYCISQSIQAQESEQKHTFGFQLSLAEHEDYGSGEVGDVAIVFQKSGGPHLNVGAFYNYKLSNRLSVQAEAVWFRLGGPNPIGWDQAANCGLCPVRLPVGVHTPVIATTFSVLAKFPLIPKLELVAGLSPHIVYERTSSMDDGYDMRHEKEFKALYAIKAAVKPVYTFYSIGAKYHISKRFALTARYHDLLSNGFLNPLKVDGKSYHISTSYHYINLNLSYNFYSFKLPKFRKRKK